MARAFDFANPNSMRGVSVADIEAAIPAGWRVSAAKNGLGKRFADPGRPGDQVRIMQGNAADPNPGKRGPYVRISRSGMVSDPVPLLGNPVLDEGRK